MPEELPTTGTEQTSTEVAEQPQTPQSQPSESSSNDSIAQTATEGASVNDALKMFDGVGRVGQASTPPKKQDSTQAKPEEGEESVQKETPQESGQNSRDYSGLDENEVKIFKNMSRLSFNQLKPLYLESKKLKADYEALKSQHENLSKESFYEHQDAYQLAPEYQQTTNNLQLVDREAAYWKAQIVKIRNGEKWNALIGYDKDGRAQFSPDQEPTPEAEADVLGALQQAFSIKGQLTEKANTIKNSFTTQHRNYLSGVQAVEKEIFKGVDQETLNKAMAKKITLFPEHRRSVPEVQIIAKLLAVLDGYQLMLNDKQAAAVTANAKTRTAVNGGPTNKTLQPVPSKANTVQSVIDEFNQAKAKGMW